MDRIHTTNTGTQDIRWGSALSGALNSSIPLSFGGYRIAVMPDQRLLYVTGTKEVNGEPHAFLAVVDTCSSMVHAEVDLGVGFGGQCAVPNAVGGTRAFVAISQALGGLDTGPMGGSNRVEILDIRSPTAPVRFGAVSPPAGSVSPYGFLHIVWSYRLNRLYVSHRGDNNIHHFSASQLNLQSFPVGGSQPVGLGISNDGVVLFVARRVTGDLLEFDLTANPPTQIGGPILLQCRFASKHVHRGGVTKPCASHIKSRRRRFFTHLSSPKAAASGASGRFD